MTDRPRIESIWYWPVKGLSGQQIEDAEIRAHAPLPHDRRWAIERGSRVFDPLNPRHIPKGKFLQLVNTARLAALEARYEPETATLTLLRRGEQLARGRLTEPAGRAIIEQFLAAWLEDEIPGPPRVVGAGEHHFFDVPRPYLSLINLETLKDLERVLGKPVDPRRFRANIYVSGLPAWAEFDWLGKKIRVAGQPLFVARERIGRCIATGVDPETGERDMNIPRTMLDVFGHKDCGLYLEPVADGRIAAGDEIGIDGEEA
jgi:hypothetical protein